jgi:gliding motility-associated-like protein
MKKIIVYSVFLIISIPTFGQLNLVPNPSFEDTVPCNSFVPPVANWTMVSGTPDYYNQIMTSCVGANNGFNNHLGYQVAKAGSAYMGFNAYELPYGLNYREVIQAQLSSPMIANKTYCVSFYVSLADSSRFATNAIGCYISSGNAVPFPAVSQINNTSGNITDTAGWKQIKGIYTATGGERYINIGNFKNDTNTTVVPNNLSSADSNTYYFVDLVSVVELPTVNAGNDTTICHGATTTQLNASCAGCWAGLKHIWQPSSGLSNDTILSPTATPSQTTTYYFSLVDTTGTIPCMSNVMDSVTITVCQYKVDVPNVFTPNNDGINDEFQTINSNISSLDCKIYNRWGTLISELIKPDETWDGRTTSGIECVSGVYYYILTATGENGKVFNQKGFVQLIR